jgi:prepilin peptidase CpaA
METSMPSFVVTVLALAGAGWDLSTRRVPNVFTFGAAALAFVYFAVVGGTAGATWSALGWATGLALFLPLFAVGALGAGDVKLLAAFGAWLGPSGALWSSLWAAMLGAAMALVVAAFNGYLSQALRNVFAILNVWRVLGPCRVAGLTLDDATGPRLAYAVPIAAGAMLALFLRHL